MNKKQRILIVGAALFAALFLFSGAMLAWQYADGKQSADAFDAVAKRHIIAQFLAETTAILLLSFHCSCPVS